VMAEVTLATAIEEISYGTPERETFEANFKADVAALMIGVSAEEVLRYCCYHHHCYHHHCCCHKFVERNGSTPFNHKKLIV
jgi:hypothetical protein